MTIYMKNGTVTQAPISYTPEMEEHLKKLSMELSCVAISIMGGPHRRELTRVWAKKLPTFMVGHDADLKLEWDTHPYEVEEGTKSYSSYRLWVSRMTVEDDAPMNHEVVLEHRYTRGWRYAWGWRRWSHGSAQAA